MAWWRFPGAMMAVVAAGCGTGPTAASDADAASVRPGDSAPEGIRYVTMWPAHGTTSFTGTPHVFVASYASIDADLPALYSRIKLLKGADRQPIAITMTTESVAGAAGGTRILVNPVASLGPGTFVLRVEALPTGYTWTMGTLARFGGDGAAESEFSTSSSPRLSRVSACEKSGATSVAFIFSEPLATASSADFSIAYADTTGGVPACSWTGPSGPSLEYSFRCSLDPTRRTLLTVRAGLQASSGAVLEGEAHEVVFASIAPNPDACRVQTLF
ncbi:MAG: hypothetical protein HYV09_38225 [Deltaproteobacteria bacterium]|nr:hypothetical protein [Deltaproteobacteria bacterium]